MYIIYFHLIIIINKRYNSIIHDKCKLYFSVYMYMHICMYAYTFLTVIPSMNKAS